MAGIDLQLLCQCLLLQHVQLSVLFYERPANGEMTAMAGWGREERRRGGGGGKSRVHPVQPAYHDPDYYQVSLATAVTSEFVGWLLYVLATCDCISGTDLLR